jgi:hypothetical protein
MGWLSSQSDPESARYSISINESHHVERYKPCIAKVTVVYNICHLLEFPSTTSERTRCASTGISFTDGAGCTSRFSGPANEMHMVL